MANQQAKPDGQTRAGRLIRQGSGYSAQLVQKLAKQGIINEIIGQKRNRRFRYEAYVRLFEEPEPTAAVRSRGHST